MTDAIDGIVTALDSNWNVSPKPSILDIATLEAGEGKRTRLQDHDIIRVFETAHNEEVPEILYDFVTTRINITVDIRTTKGRNRLKLMENEIRRLIHTKRKGDGVNFDRLVYKTRTDLSDRSKQLFRMTFQVEVIIFAELIP